MKRTGIARGTSSMSRTPMARGKRVKAKRETPRRRDAPREDADWWYDATMTLVARCGGCCEKCGRALVNNLERHHRQRRRDGGDRISNLLALHSSCHTHITTHPAEAVTNGWIVPAHVTDPGSVPVLIAGAWWLLHDDGTKAPTPAP